MSFWSDASPAVKGVIVIGIVGLLYLAIARIAMLPPFFEEPEQAQTRGVGGP